MADLESTLRAGVLTGFVFQTATCQICGARAWCAEYRELGHGKMLL